RRGSRPSGRMRRRAFREQRLHGLARHRSTAGWPMTRESAWSKPLTAVAAPLDEANVDTGRIFPSRFLRKPRSFGYHNVLFRDERYDEAGNERPGFVLNRKEYRSARILVAGPNFACGSSREPAVYALVDAGFRCVIAPS